MHINTIEIKPLNKFTKFNFIDWFMERNDTEDVNLAATLSDNFEHLLLPTEEGAELSARDEGKPKQLSAPLS